MYYIYKITNTATGLCYIGLTSNIARRKIRHFTDLRCQRHDNHFLQKAFNQYGQENFTFEVLFEGDVTYEEISLKEREYIAKYDSYWNGYNQNEGGNFGPSNGGSHLTKSDIFSILSAIEFCSRPGAVLSEIFEVSVQTISRIKNGISHKLESDEYFSKTPEERRLIFEIFDNSCNFVERKANKTILVGKRKLTEHLVHLTLANEENNRIIPLEQLAQQYFHLSATNTLSCILRGLSYKDYALSYLKLTLEEKDNLVSLLRNHLV